MGDQKDHDQVSATPTARYDLETGDERDHDQLSASPMARFDQETSDEKDHGWVSATPKACYVLGSDQTEGRESQFNGLKSLHELFIEA